MIGEEEWRLKKAGNLIKLLALTPGYRLHREQTLELLWPGLDSEPAANNLHQALHVARRTLEPAAPANTASHCLALGGALLDLCPEDEPLWVHVEAFESAAATARRSREPAAYRAALELYVGDLLPEDLYEEWTEEKREELKQLYLTLLLELAALHEEREEYKPAIEALGWVVSEEPANEEAHTGLMRLHALSGQHHEAILQYERFRRTLREELDEEPGEASRRLYDEIRAGYFSAALSPPPAGHPSEEPPGSSRHNLSASLGWG
jgi:DNA-binding SARP family transcriptional activator